jgi:acyl-coenzyme A thioesterase PaaI-like protein
MKEKAFQDNYPDEFSYCYGCGRLNREGYQIKSYWDGDEAVCTYTPKPYHISIPGYVYGGLIASLIDCHSTGTAAAAAHRETEHELHNDLPFRFLTGTLNVKYLQPTPLGVPLVLRSRVKEVKGRKVTVTTQLFVDGEVTATGEVIAIQVPKHLMPK